MSQNNNKLISVLMGVYNCATTLVQAVNSIIQQSYTNWELIIYDDNSTDETYATALSLADKDSRIKVFKNPSNLTLAPTLNNCFSKASGEYLARMDGDDVCDSDRLLKEIEFLENHSEYSIVSCLMNLFDDEGTYGTVKYKEIPNAYDLIYGSPICHAGCMVRREMFEQLNGYDCSKNTERVEDYDLWIRAYQNGYLAYNIQEPLYSMRDDRASFKRKKFRYRINEYKLKKRCLQVFNLPIKYKLFSYKPIVLGLIPTGVYSLLHKNKHQNI